MTHSVEGRRYYVVSKTITIFDCFLFIKKKYKDGVQKPLQKRGVTEKPNE
jgi:hypothetical protein